MGADTVVVDAPGFDEGSCFGAVPEPFLVQALIAKSAVEALVGAILPRLARRNVSGLDAVVCEPAQDGGRHELWAIVGAKVERSTPNADQAGEDLDYAARANAASDVDRQAFSRPF